MWSITAGCIDAGSCRPTVCLVEQSRDLRSGPHPTGLQDGSERQRGDESPAMSWFICLGRCGEKSVGEVVGGRSWTEGTTGQRTERT